MWCSCGSRQPTRTASPITGGGVPVGELVAATTPGICSWTTSPPWSSSRSAISQLWPASTPLIRFPNRGCTSLCRASATSRTSLAPIFGEGVVLVPSDPTPLAEIYEGIRAGIAEARDASAVADSDHTFVPHVTVAYANRAAATASIRTALDAVTPTRAVSVRFRRLSLIMMHRDRRMYEWVVLGTVALHS